LVSKLITNGVYNTIKMLKDEKVVNTINFVDGNTSGSFEGGKVGVK